ncbi:alpha/beta-hydrolase [Roridomyces roridus]|uniref:Alpha/beta-hydrolase n=1 Tax=Roridomyces roridus TaxID=1738132 RepID=A0AAD7FU95_9AGAR|nr:alpha/beta-hydrolase [Roridomyces roridus]
MDCKDVCYKKVGDVSIHLDVYPPELLGTATLPTVCYLHGGGLTVGNRTSWFPHWIKARMVAAGFAFISAEYRLLPSATVHDIIDDIKDLFAFLAREDTLFKTDQGVEFGVDSKRIAIAGSSAGGLCAYLAGIHAVPKPKAVLAMYAQGGNCFTPQYLVPKTEPFFLGREILDPKDFTEFIHPNCASLPAISNSPLAYHPPTSPTPGWPANPRMPLARLYFQLGVVLDYMTGQHEPSLSAELRSFLGGGDSDPLALQESMKARISSKHHRTIPQFNITSEFPPAFLCHGAIDSAVLPEESEHMERLLKAAGVSVRLLLVGDASHSFDYAADAESKYGEHFDEMAEFLKGALN